MVAFDDGARRLARTGDVDIAGGVVRHTVGHAAEDPPDALRSAVSHHNDAGLPANCFPDEGIGWPAADC